MLLLLWLPLRWRSRPMLLVLLPVLLPVLPLIPSRLRGTT